MVSGQGELIDVYHNRSQHTHLLLLNRYQIAGTEGVRYTLTIFRIPLWHYQIHRLKSACHGAVTPSQFALVFSHLLRLYLHVA